VASFFCRYVLRNKASSRCSTKWKSLLRVSPLCMLTFVTNYILGRRFIGL
jgi:hypothetical protein